MARRALLHKGFKKGNRRFAHGGWVDKRDLCWGRMRDEDGICVDRGGVAGKRRLRERIGTALHRKAKCTNHGRYFLGL